MPWRERSAAGGMREARPASSSVMEKGLLLSGACTVPMKTPFLSSVSTSSSTSRCSSVALASSNASSANGSLTELGWSRRAVAGQRTPTSANEMTIPSRPTRHLYRAPCTMWRTVARTLVSRCSEARKACARALFTGSVRSVPAFHGWPVGALLPCIPPLRSLAARSASRRTSTWAEISSPRLCVLTSARPAPISPAARLRSPRKTAQ
mmetsp:Transcript_42479/g.104631  ORF Transcript_42479/g.104631 Transcript_42479/m.104631 type:complete len:208 (+) Transcript_42479:710-1333(+)